MPNFAKASILTMFVMIAGFLVFLQTQIASDAVRALGLVILPFSLPIFIIATLRTKPKRTMKKFVRNLLISNGFPFIFLLFAQPILAILAVVIVLVFVITLFRGSTESSTSNSSNGDFDMQSWQEERIRAHVHEKEDAERNARRRF